MSFYLHIIKLTPRSICCRQKKHVHKPQGFTSWKLMFSFLLFIEKLYPPVCSTVALFAIPHPTASGLQSEREKQTKKYNFSIKGKKKNKIPACQTRCTTVHCVLILKVLFMTGNFLLWMTLCHQKCMILQLSRGLIDKDHY